VTYSIKWLNQHFDILPDPCCHRGQEMADYNISEEWKEDEDQNVTDETNLITDSHTSSS